MVALEAKVSILVEYEATIANNNITITNNNTTIANNTTTLASNTHLIKELQQQVAMLTQQTTTLTQQRDDYLTHITQLQSQHYELSQQHTDLTQQNADLSTQVSTLTQQLSTLSTNNLSMDREKSRIHEEQKETIVALESQLETTHTSLQTSTGPLSHDSYKSTTISVFIMIQVPRTNPVGNLYANLLFIPIHMSKNLTFSFLSTTILHHPPQHSPKNSKHSSPPTMKNATN